MYHNVSPVAPPKFRKYTVSPSSFAAQMRILALARYRVIRLDAYVDARRAGSPLSPRTAVITFDDGFRDAIRYAVPILRARRFTATFFIVAGLLGRRSEWLADSVADLALADGDTVLQLHRGGFQIGAHSMTHPRLSRLSDQDVIGELSRSRAVLEDLLGSTVTHMAYPFGDYDARVRSRAADTGYRSACSVRIGRSAPDDDVLGLHRIPISGTDTPLDFLARLRRGHSLRETAASKVRRAIDRRPDGSS
jgi:peptidoglycan/xylan/chitin deacetylase (PgdA/CDA1 family)